MERKLTSIKESTLPHPHISVGGHSVPGPPSSGPTGHLTSQAGKLAEKRPQVRHTRGLSLRTQTKVQKAKHEVLRILPTHLIYSL